MNHIFSQKCGLFNSLDRAYHLSNRKSKPYIYSLIPVINNKWVNCQHNNMCILEQTWHSLTTCNLLFNYLWHAIKLNKMVWLVFLLRKQHSSISHEFQCFRGKLNSAIFFLFMQRSLSVKEEKQLLACHWSQPPLQGDSDNRQ